MGLEIPLPLLEPEAHADAEPRKPSAPTALTLAVPHPLLDTAGVREIEGEPEEVGLALGEKELLTEGQGEEVCVAHCMALML